MIYHNERCKLTNICKNQATLELVEFDVEVDELPSPSDQSGFQQRIRTHLATGTICERTSFGEKIVHHQGRFYDVVDGKIGDTP